MSIPFTSSCARCIQKGSKNCNCPHYSACPYFENKFNVIHNRFSSTDNELIVYNYEFEIHGNPNVKDIDRSRKFKYNSNGHLEALSDDVSLSDLMDTMLNSRKRSLDNLHGYARANKWRYFITLTFDPNIIDSTVKDKVAYAWQLFRQKIQYRFKNVKLLFVFEKHKNGGIHLHGFAGACDFSKFLVRAIDTKQYLYDYDYVNRCKVYKLDNNGLRIPNKHYLQPITDTYVDRETGELHTLPVFSFDSNFFNGGFSSIVELTDSTKSEHIASYLAKYFTKDTLSNVSYDKKSYFHTKNLNFKNKNVFQIPASSLSSLVQNLRVKKSNNRFTIYTFSDSEYIKAQGLTEVQDFKATKLFSKDNKQLEINGIDEIF